MIVFPAIDMLGGKVVRLHQGRLDLVTVYNDDPADQAARWAEQGAEWLHVVDLDGAVSGRPVNDEHVQRIVERTGLKVEVGGGVRSMETVRRLFGHGATRVVLGTAVITQPEFVAEAVEEYGDRVMASIDARDGKVAIEGWKQGTAYSAFEVVQDLEVLGIGRFLYTDINLDGTQRGINYGAYRALAQHVDIPIIASGGVSSLEDIRDLKTIQGVEGVIIGKALYEGIFTVAEAIQVANEA